MRALQFWLFIHGGHSLIVLIPSLNFNLTHYLNSAQVDSPARWVEDKSSDSALKTPCEESNFMPQQDTSAMTSLIPPEPVHEGAQQFTNRVQGMLDGHQKDDATVAIAFEGMDEMIDMIAAGLYTMASMLVGEGEDSVRLVETAIANADIAACSDATAARKSSRRALSEAALELLASRDAKSLGAPQGLEHVATCIEDDDLDSVGEAAGVSRVELEHMMAGPDRERVRTWLTSLPSAMRTIFVLRAVAGFTAAETAGLLAANGGPAAAGWTPEAVRELFRQGLCSLASQLIHASSRA
jgi:hypothetical protein